MPLNKETKPNPTEKISTNVMCLLISWFLKRWVKVKVLVKVTESFKSNMLTLNHKQCDKQTVQ